MLHLNIIKVKTPEEMGKAAADEFEAVIHAKPACVMGLATGSTPLPLYRELIAREQAGIIDFSRVRSANLDEYKGLAPVSSTFGDISPPFTILRTARQPQNREGWRNVA